MTTKTTGAELKRFYQDATYWPQDNGNTWHDDETITVNGEPFGHRLDIGTIPDSAVVTIEGGIVFGPQWTTDNEPSFEGYFKRWRKLQTTKSFVVECDEAKLDAVLAAIKAAGGKVSK